MSGYDLYAPQYGPQHAPVAPNYPNYVERSPMYNQGPPNQFVMQQQPQPAGQQYYPANKIQASGVQQVEIDETRPWTTGLCDCGDDMKTCCLVFWCWQCYLCCCLSPKVGEHCATPIALNLCGYSPAMIYRTKLRAAHGIEGTAVEDCCISTCCQLCSICQMARELDNIEENAGQSAFQEV